MNREIKFRGNRKDNGEQVFACIITGTEHNPTTGFMSPPNSFFVEVIPESIGQYSGLKDKNGVEIYEGDIIELINELGVSVKVVCEFGTVQREIMGHNLLLCDINGFYFKNQFGKATFPIVKNYLGKNDVEIFEVIGNIHDNPELLK